MRFFCLFMFWTNALGGWLNFLLCLASPIEGELAAAWFCSAFGWSVLVAARQEVIGWIGN